MRAIVLATLVVAATARGEAPLRRGVAYGWLTFPSGESVRKVREGPELDVSGKPIGAGLVYAVPAGSDPFDPKLVHAVREYLASKYTSARRLTLAAWSMTSQGTAVDAVHYRVFARERSGTWKPGAPVGFSAPADGVALPPTPFVRDLRAEEAGRSVIQAWLSALDRRDVHACRDLASAEFRAERDWEAELAGRATRLGPNRSRRELAREYGPISRDPQRRTFVTIEYRSVYANERDVLEGVTAAPCGPDRWCVMGWGVRR